MATLRWMGVPEAEVRMVEGTYEKTTSRVVVAEGASEEFEVKTKGQGHEYLCDTGMPVRNGNLANDRTTTTKAASVRKQLGTKKCKSNEGRQ